MNQPGAVEAIRVMNEVKEFIDNNLADLCKELIIRDDGGKLEMDSKFREAGNKLLPVLATPYLTLEGMIKNAAVRLVAKQQEKL